MKNLKLIISYAILLAFPFLSGCTKIPDDFPRLATTVVRVVRNGEPEKGLRVIVDSEQQVKYASSGTTDNDGFAIIRTDSNRHFYIGAPVGTITVTLRPEPYVITPEEAKALKNMSREEALARNTERNTEMQRRRSLIPPYFYNPKAAPLQFEVAADQDNVFEIDLGDPKWTAKR